MSQSFASRSRFPVGLVGLIFVQFVCVIFFIGDVVDDFRELAPGGAGSVHLSVEAFAALCLLAAIVFEIRYLLALLRSKSNLEHSLSLATSAINDVIDAHFDLWKLSAAERDVATFLVKGLSISEIAQVRGCAEGTVKAHLNAIYRKSGARNRGEVLSLVIDSLMASDAESDHTGKPSAPNDRSLAAQS